MDSVERSVLYLRGLIDGSGFDENSKEARIFNAIADSLETISDELLVMHPEDEQNMVAFCDVHGEKTST